MSAVTRTGCASGRSPSSERDNRGQKSSVAAAPVRPPEGSGAAPRKLSYKEQQELKVLPARIEVLEAEQAELQTRVNSADFYKEGAEAIAHALARIAAVDAELLDTLVRWDELDSRKIK